VLREIVRSVDGLHESHQSVPLPGSSAANEITRDQPSLVQTWGTEPVRMTYLLADKLRRAARDYLRSLDRLLRGEVRSFPSLAVARITVEICSRAWWLLEDGMTARERVARGMTDRLHSLWQRKKLPSAMQAVDPPDPKIAQISTSAAALNYRYIVSPTGQPYLDTSRKSATELVQLMVAAMAKDRTGKVGSRLGGTYYRLTSAPVHGTVYGLNILLTTPDRTAGATAAAWVGEPLLVTPSRLALPIAAFAADAYLYIATKQAALYGWPETSWPTPPLELADRLYELLERTRVSDDELEAAKAEKAQDQELA
jgi:hypothetical protein